MKATGRFARPDEREQIGREINTETAEVWFAYADLTDPYSDVPNLPQEEWCIGRMYFAVDPDVGISVALWDLPEDKREALRAKQAEADRRGWEWLL